MVGLELSSGSIRAQGGNAAQTGQHCRRRAYLGQGGGVTATQEHDLREGRTAPSTLSSVRTEGPLPTESEVVTPGLSTGVGTAPRAGRQGWARAGLAGVPCTLTQGNLSPSGEQSSLFGLKYGQTI